MTPADRKALSETIRGLRQRLLHTQPTGSAPTGDWGTLLFRVVVLKHIEAIGLSEAVMARLQGASKEGFGEASILARALTPSATGLARLLPELFGADAEPLRSEQTVCALREVFAELDRPSLAPCWSDDLTPGWVFQFWNDPAREQIDAKVNRGAKVALHELAPKTQMFTERYLVDWTLQNSLGALWFDICSTHGWTPEVVADGTLDRLETRRAEWRTMRRQKRVPVTEPMPLYTEQERRWADFIPPSDRALHDPLAPRSIRDLTLLDPAVGTGHFLVVAFDHLMALYQEEARHRGETNAARWSPEAAATRILEHNLHGIDLDPHAVGLARTMLRLKALRAAPTVRPAPHHLLSTHRDALRPSEPPLECPREQSAPPDEVWDEVCSTAGRFGSLVPIQPELAEPRSGTAPSGPLARFVQMMAPAQYDLVVTNPPYQGSKRFDGSEFLAKHYPHGSADLYAAFLLRGLQLARPGGISAMLTMRSWMFTKQYAALREHLLTRHRLVMLGDFGHGAFDQVGGMVVSVCTSIFRRDQPADTATALQLEPHTVTRDRTRADQLRAAIRCQERVYTFAPDRLRTIPDWPLVYWWTPEALETYHHSVKLADHCAVRQGMATGDNHRFLRRPWELSPAAIWRAQSDTRAAPPAHADWVPYLKGAGGKAWFEPLDHVVRWTAGALEIKTHTRGGRPASRPQNEPFYFRSGVAYATIGNRFSARLRRYSSVFDVSGSSVFSDDPAQLCCMLNRSAIGKVLADLNPTVNFQVGDVRRLPLEPVEGAPEIIAVLEQAFTMHERHRETSVEFVRPGPSPWPHARAWAQAAVDRPAGTPLPPYQPQLEPPAPEHHVSFALGCALARFESSPRQPPAALPHGLLLLDRTQATPQPQDDLAHPACAPLHRAWETHGSSLPTARNHLRDYLALDFFARVHEPMYAQRPIYWPLSSARRAVVAWVSIHHLDAHTFPVLLERLQAIRSRCEALALSGDEQSTRLYGVVAELSAFMALIQQCVERGPPPTTADTHQCPPRAHDHPFQYSVEDGVMVNSAALWPLLAPQWKEPRKWWSDLARARGRTDRDWSHVARRYWPARVEAKCATEPSLSVRHGCFWQYHPARAWAWELRLQQRYGADFQIHEAARQGPTGSEIPDSSVLRTRFLEQHGLEALQLVEAEVLRRMGRRSDTPVAELRLAVPGLWSRFKDAVHALEARISKRQGTRFRLRAPDEPARGPATDSTAAGRVT